MSTHTKAETMTSNVINQSQVFVKQKLSEIFWPQAYGVNLFSFLRVCKLYVLLYIIYFRAKVNNFVMI